MPNRDGTSGLYTHPQDRNVAPPLAVTGDTALGNGLQAPKGFVGWTPGNTQPARSATSPVVQTHNGQNPT